MTLADLITALATRGAMKPSRVPAMKTSLKVSDHRVNSLKINGLIS